MMSAPTREHAASRRARLLRRGLLLEGLTITWNLVEAGAAIAFGWLASSVALVAFGLDGVIEVIAAASLFGRLRAEARGGDAEEAERRERVALGVVGWTFLALAAYVVVDGSWTLLGHRTPERSRGGIAVSVIALAIMPALGWAKLGVGRAIGSKALVADARESFSCAALSGTVLIGVTLNTLFGWWWADPVAALVMVPFLVREGREALEEARGAAVCSSGQDGD